MFTRRKCKKEEPTTLFFLFHPLLTPVHDKSVHKYICLCYSQLFLCTHTQNIWVELSSSQSYSWAVMIISQIRSWGLYFHETSIYYQKSYAEDFLLEFSLLKNTIFRRDMWKGFQVMMCCEHILQTKYQIKYDCIPIAPVYKKNLMFESSFSCWVNSSK